jgi:hypothetical protein
MKLSSTIVARQARIETTQSTSTTQDPAKTTSLSNGGYSTDRPTASALPEANLGSTVGANIIPIAGGIIGVFLLFSFFLLVRRLRRLFPMPKFIPTKLLKSLWVRWDPGNARRKAKAAGLDMSDGDMGPSVGRHGEMQSGHPLDIDRQRAVVLAIAGLANGIDRRSSIRSVATLPIYTASANPNETVLGREGDRAGVDTVLALPEDSRVAEELRDMEMEALYRVRVARRRAIEEREQGRERRRAERRLARSRGDREALRAMRAARQEERDAAQAAGGRTHAGVAAELAMARAVHATLACRERPIGEANYADVGVVRWDGTRARKADQPGVTATARQVVGHTAPPSNPADPAAPSNPIPLDAPGIQVRRHARADSDVSLGSSVDLADAEDPEREVARQQLGLNINPDAARPSYPVAGHVGDFELGAPPAYFSPIGETRPDFAEATPVTGGVISARG